MTKRSFTIIDFPKKGETYGRYLANTPQRAASKAFTQLARIIGLTNENDQNHMVFVIKEITQGSDNKLYTYIGTRVELAEPIIKNIAGKEVVYKYKNIVAKQKNNI